MKAMRYKFRRPTHPGELLREDILPALRITVSELARRLRLSKQTLIELLKEKRPITADMAVRLSQVVGRTPAGWLKMQQVVDLWDLEHSAANKDAIKRLSNGLKRKAG